MRKYIVLVALLLSMPGCLFHYRNPAPKQATETVDPIREPSAFVRIGMGHWRDSTGKEHYQPVYIRADEVGEKGPKGPAGVKGPTSRPVALESLAPRKEVTIEVRPDPLVVRQGKPQPPARFKTETNGGGPGWWVFIPPWFTAKEYLPPMPLPAVVQPKSPGYHRNGTDVGEGGGGSSTGGGILESTAQKVARSPYIIMGIGALAILGSIGVWFITKNVRMTLIVLVVGIVIFGLGVAIEMFPWLVLVAIIVIAVALIGFGLWWAYNNRAALANKLALQKVAEGIENADLKVQYVDSTGQTVIATVRELTKQAIGRSIPEKEYASVNATIEAAKTAAKV